jgi:hypothetical protein
VRAVSLGTYKSQYILRVFFAARVQGVQHVQVAQRRRPFGGLRCVLFDRTSIGSRYRFKYEFKYGSSPTTRCICEIECVCLWCPMYVDVPLIRLFLLVFVFLYSHPGPGTCPSSSSGSSSSFCPAPSFAADRTSERPFACSFPSSAGSQEPGQLAAPQASDIALLFGPLHFLCRSTN